MVAQHIRINAGTNTPPGCCWVGFELPVFLTIFSVALEGYVCPTASLSVNSCLELTLWLTDAPINHHGQGGTDAISHLIDSSGKKKIAFWNGRQSRSGGIDFGSPQFIFINCKLGFGAWKEDTLVCECIFFTFFFFIIPRVERGHVSHFWQCSLTLGLKKKRPKSTKQGSQRTTGNLHGKTRAKVLMINFKSEVVARFRVEWQQQCLNLTPAVGWRAETKEESCSSDASPVETAAMAMC